jgi:hypothetical protein
MECTVEHFTVVYSQETTHAMRPTHAIRRIHPLACVGLVPASCLSMLGRDYSISDENSPIRAVYGHSILILA